MARLPTHSPTPVSRATKTSNYHTSIHPEVHFKGCDESRWGVVLGCTRGANEGHEGHESAGKRREPGQDLAIKVLILGFRIPARGSSNAGCDTTAPRELGGVYAPTT